MAESIIQKYTDRCYICGQYPCGDSLDRHHVFFGRNRKKSEKYGLTVYLHHNKCHIFGKMSVHGNAQVNRKLQAHVQKIAMRHYNWTEDEFRKEFGKSYI
jgi:hypothetical protein